MKKSKIFQSALLASVKHLVCGYSSRSDGDMRNLTMRARFAASLGLDGTTLSKPQQVHGNKVAFIHEIDATPIVQGVDGLASNGSPLCVITADCVPILAVDPAARVLGVAHAGWKGTIGEIAKNLIDMMIDKGADKKRVRVSLGPHICLRCYNVSFDRAQLFQKKYGDFNVVKKIDDVWHIDIGEANVRELQGAGILEENIDLFDFCTSCNSKNLFSYRKDSEDLYGETMGIIGWNN